MVVGNGMMAKAFGEFASDDSVIIFASGVSNSKEEDPALYKKETDLLHKYSNNNSLLVYFSTCSIFDPKLRDSKYVRHKLATENYISSHFSSFWIIRLPNVIGPSCNPHTMTNFLHHAIRNGIEFKLQENAYRYFIDVEDVQSVIGKAIRHRALPRGKYNLFYPHAFRVKDLVHCIEKHEEKKAFYQSLRIPDEAYGIELSPELEPFLSFNGKQPDEYLKKALLKYYS
jgi:nucleoside-diphosphate-sugar epimerase